MSVLSNLFSKRERKYIKVEIPSKESIKALEEMGIDPVVHLSKAFMNVLEKELEKRRNDE